MTLDFSTSLGREVDIVALRVVERTILITYVVQEAINITGDITISKTFEETEIVEIGEQRCNIGDIEKLQVVVGINLVAGIGLVG